MNDEFDINALLAEYGQQPQSIQDEVPAFNVNDIEQFIGKTYSSEGIALPDSFNGLSENVPVNSSPVDVVDRIKLSPGNLKGQIDYLRTKFDDATVNENGDLVVKNQGKWHLVDAKDPWSASETIKDVAEVAPDLLNIGVQALFTLGGKAALVAGGLAAPATGGTTAIGGLATDAALTATGGALAAKMRTTMGKAFGTYEATFEEEMGDIGLETLFNLAGFGIAKGIKPTAKVLAKGFDAVSDVASKTSETSKNLMSKFFGTVTGIGDERAMTLIDDASQASNTLRVLAKTGEKNVVQALKTASIDALKDPQSVAMKEMRTLWNSQAKEVINSVDDAFKLVDADGAKQQLATMINNGFVKATARETGEEIGLDQMLKLPSSAMKFVVRNADEISKVNPSISSSPEALKIVKDLTKFFEQNMDETVHTGKAGAQRAMLMRRAMSDKLETLRSVANDPQRRLSFLNPILGAHEEVASKLYDEPLNVATKGAYAKMNQVYGMGKELLEPLMKAEGDQAIETYLNKLTTGARFNVATKSGRDELISFAKTYFTPDAATKFEKAFKQVAVNDALMATDPIVRPGLIGATGVTGALTGVASGNPALGGSFLLGATATSPRLARNALIGGANMSRKVLPAAQKVALESARLSKAVIGMLPKNARIQLLNNPIALQSLLSTAFDAPQASEATTQELMSRVKGQ